VSAVAAIGAVAGDPVINQIGVVHAVQPPQANGFADILAAGMRQVDAKLSTADSLVRQFALDDSVPVHKVTYALEEARLSVELAMQVRARLVEGYRDLMNMQL
jgi:flagellar hook-basal body complex protein FliE